MTVFVGSRYATGTVSTVTVDGTNSQFLSRGPSPLPTPLGYTTYVVSDRERLDAIASRFYGRSDYWWVIADANPSVNPTDPLPAGTQIWIPDARGVY